MTNKTDTTDFNYFDESFGELPTSLQESIKIIIKEEGYEKPRVEKKIIHQAGNFLSFLYEVNITGETVDGYKLTPLFIKQSITLDKIKLANVPQLYSREIFIYNDLSKVFVMLQDAANVPDKTRFTLLKKYDSNSDAIIMENLSKKGFRTYHKTKIVPLKFAELSITKLAKFHALSYVIKNKIPKYFEDKIKVIRHPFNLDSDWDEFTNNICAAAVQVLKDEIKAKITNFAPRMRQAFHKYLKDIVPPNGCLCHGDFKFLNIMVKEDDGEASEVQPIDYQLVYYGTPVDDFLFFIFTGTDREFRKKHLSYLKDLYFKNFAEFLRYFNMDTDSVYSRQEFENDYQERLEMGLAFGLYLCAFTFANVDDFDVGKLTLSELPIVANEMFADRVRDIVEDYIDWGYL